MNENAAFNFPFPACAYCKLHPDQTIAASSAAVANCPVMDAIGKFGWPCHRTLTQVINQGEAA